MGRRIVVTCGVLFACMCAQADAQIMYSADGRLYEIGADGSDRTRFTPSTSPQAGDSEPEWSPDGTQLAVIHERDPADLVTWPRIDLLNQDGSVRQRVTSVDPDVTVSTPRWSPDGDRLAFVRVTGNDDSAFSEIVVRDLDSGDEFTLVRQEIDERASGLATPEWPPDGTAVLYSSFQLNRREYFRSSIRVAPLDGGPTQLIMREAHSPAFSPDGSRIAFISIADRNGFECGSDECSYNGELYVMDADGGNPQRLTHNKGSDIAPDWAPDGSRIAFSSDRNFRWSPELYSIEPDGDCLTWLTNGTAFSVDPDWRPDTVSTDPGGCGSASRPALIEVDLAPARAFHAARALWLGRRWHGLLLSYVERSAGYLHLGYQDCAFYSRAACPHGADVITQPVCSRGSYVNVLRGPAERRRNALLQKFGNHAFMLLTGGADVQIFPQSPRVVRALRPFPRETPVEELRPPAIPASLAREIERVVRLKDRLGSIAAVAKRIDGGKALVRQRLDNARSLEDFGHRVRTKRC